MTATERLASDAAGVARAAALLRAGGLVAIPTETVYGLAVRADDAAAVGRLFAAKGRPSDNPLIVHVADATAVAAVAAEVTPLARRLLARFAPGPLTVVLPARDDLPRAVTGGLDTVAVRVPEHPVARAVLVACGLPLAAPSANRSGRPSPTTAAHVLADLDDRIDAVLDGGPTRIGLESTVVDARGDVPVVLREGAVTREDLGAVTAADGGGDARGARSPGTRHHHYAPGLPVVLAPQGGGPAAAAALGSRSGTVGLVRVGSAGGADVPDGVRVLAEAADAAARGAALGARLRRAEAEGRTALVVESVPEVGVGRAVMDRLRRAAAASGGEDLVGRPPA
ncbi:MAG: L-threonylcarbamoyladenylate synthase [Nitriliruptoraceae bacterium]